VRVRVEADGLRYGTANGDIDGSKIRDAIGPIQKADHTAKEITPMYAKFMTRVRPVMRHFFTERHRNPLAWFTMRLNYTRSVAVTSIVGWVLGVGDRHCSNILIDTKSGEVIHIDFGIVFEKVSRQEVEVRM
jgi:ataxia telangiectasia mutated family protein